MDLWLKILSRGKVFCPFVIKYMVFANWSSVETYQKEKYNVIEPSLTATHDHSFLSRRSGTIHTFTLVQTSVQRPPLYNGNGHLSAWQLPKELLHKDQLIKDWRTVYLMVKGHQTWSMPHIADLSFCLVSVLLLHFTCGMYLYDTTSLFFTALCFQESPSSSPRKTTGDNSPATTEYLKMARKGGGRKGMEWSRQSHTSYKNC